MKRIERWIVLVTCIHAFLLVAFQWMLTRVDHLYYMQPVYKYIGVWQLTEGNVVETIDRLFQNVLSF
ncbi:DUF5359 family protein [Pontibacillus litoralis]|uniref:Uncharacterized protein n=1 Tax=Pontibacillus litoralis JSM 072002 TaxID=1385512 RepID=A0A0A5GAB7_9BACI|nr:DUF5359 family protein [Pontibacillus litoralis]KGX88030.1 hypothetical protein N784_12880 [Pontibacillus litoralis JSM 072002]